MSEQQFHQLVMKRLDDQDKKSEERAEAQYRIYQNSSKEMRELKESITSIQSKTDEMYKIFTGVSNFRDVSVWLLKGIILIGTGVGVVYGFIIWLKK